MTKLNITLCSCFVAILMLQFCTQPTTPTSMADTTAIGPQKPFPDFGFMLDTQYHGPVFKLSQDFPSVLPTPPLPPFFEIDFKKNWKEYLLAVRQYCFEGNTEVDFRVENNKVRNWYHVPWQHFGPNGREGYHGLTKEAPVQPKQLAMTQLSDSSGAWAVGFFNDVAGYTIGRVWEDHDHPDVKKMEGGFKNGAVLFKILFLSMRQAEAESTIPFLKNGQWWDAYATYTFNNTNREPIRMALIQMDIMIRDDRAPSGWIFGNFQYNGAMNQASKWDNLVPLGIMWGQDPTDNTNTSNPQPVSTIINPALKETIINPDTKELPPTHLGWNGRLNGPVDDPVSSCYSCHSTAEYPAASPINPRFDPDTLKANPIGSPGWMRWFSNLKCGIAFDPEKAVSTDFCLQLAESIQNYDTWHGLQGGLWAKNYKQDGLESTSTKKATPLVKVFPLGRRNM